MRITWKLVAGILTLLILATVVAVPVAAGDPSQETIVKLNVAQLTVNVDENIAEWGYGVSDNPSVVRHDLSYVAVVTPGSTVKIAVDLPIPGWYLETDNGEIGGTYKNEITVENVTGAVTVNIKAHEYAKVTVTFNSNGGSAVTQQEVYKGQPADEPQDPFKFGYTFAGWYTDNGTFQHRWNFADSVNADLTLYAKWVAVPCYVTFDPDNGSASWTEIYEYGDKIVQPADPEKTGYTFGGWYNGSAKWDFNNNLVKSDMTLKAQWTPILYTVHFDAAGGSPVPEDQSVKYGEKVTRPANPTRSSYTFQGWYYGSKIWNFTTDVVTSDMTLIASWKYTGGGGGGGSTPAEPAKEVYYAIVDVNGQVIITIPATDENGNRIVVPVTSLVMTAPVTGTVYVADITAIINALGFQGISDILVYLNGVETVVSIHDFHIDTVEEALSLNIPVYGNYIGGNGYAPVLVEDAASSENIAFYAVIEIITNVTGGNLKEVNFKVPLDVLAEKGFTAMDVVMYHGITENDQRIWYPLVTTLEGTDGTYAYYKSLTDGASPFGIMFLKNATSVEKTVTPVIPDEPVTPVATPVGVAGILAGLGAGALLMRRK